MTGTGGPRLSSDLVKRLERLTFVARRTFRGAGSGQRRARAAGVSTEFRDHRAYAPGDDLRHLDWNLLARLDRLYLKRFHDEQDVTVHLVLDASASMGFGRPPKLRAAQDLLAAAGCVALTHQDRAALHVLGGAAPGSSAPLSGRAGLRRLLELLDGVAAAGEVSLPSALAAVARAVRRPGIVVVASDFLSPGAASALERLAHARHQVHALHVLAPQELDPARDEELLGDVRLVDSETGAEVVASLSPRLLALYGEALADLERELASWAGRCEGTVTRCASDAPLERLVFEELQLAGVLA